MGRTVAGSMGAATAADQLLGLQRATGVGSGLQPMGLLLLRDLDSASDLTCRQDGHLECTGGGRPPARQANSLERVANRQGPGPAAANRCRVPGTAREGPLLQPPRQTAQE